MISIHDVWHDDDDLKASGLDIALILRWRRQQYALLCATHDGLSLTYADDATEAAGMLISMIRNGLPADEIGPLPDPIKAILADHRSGCH